jgi:hypothetical protein
MLAVCAFRPRQSGREPEPTCDAGDMTIEEAGTARALASDLCAWIIGCFRMPSAVSGSSERSTSGSVTTLAQ